MFYWRRDRDFTSSSEPCEGLAVCRAKAIPSFPSYLALNPLNVGPATGIKRVTSRSAVKCGSDWFSLALVTALVIQLMIHCQLVFSFVVISFRSWTFKTYFWFFRVGIESSSWWWFEGKGWFEHVFLFSMANLDNPEQQTYTHPSQTHTHPNRDWLVTSYITC